MNQTAGHPTKQTAGHSTNMTAGDKADQSEDQLEAYRLAPTINLPAQPAEIGSTDSAQLARDSINRLAQHAGTVSSPLPSASLQVNVINNEANDMAHYSPLGNADDDADHSKGQGSSDQNPTRKAATIQVVTATDYSAQLAGVTIGQAANLADEDSSAKKADTIKVVTATDSTA